MPPVKCIFCGSSPITDEHVISKWISRILNQDPRQASPRYAAIHSRYRMNRDGSRKNEKHWRKARNGPLTFAAKCVCTPCNSRWMGTIEQGVKPYLTPMILDQPVALDQSARTALAKWLGLKAVIDRYAHTPVLPAPDDWIGHFYAHHAPPSTWHIRIGRYVGKSVTRTASGEIVSYQANTLSPFSIQKDVWMVTFAIGCFFGQVICYDRPTLLLSDPRFFRQVWPHPLAGFDRAMATHLYVETWPPERWLDDADFENSARNFREPR